MLLTSIIWVMKKCMYLIIFLNGWKSNIFIKVEVFFLIFFQINKSEPNFLVKIKYSFSFPCFHVLWYEIIKKFFMNNKGYYQLWIYVSRWYLFLFLKFDFIYLYPQRRWICNHGINYVIIIITLTWKVNTLKRKIILSIW